MQNALPILVITLSLSAGCASQTSSLCAENGSPVEMTAATSAGFSADEALNAASAGVIPVWWENDPDAEQWPTESNELHLKISDASNAREDTVGSHYCPAGLWLRAEVELYIDGGKFRAKDKTDIGFRGTLPNLELMIADQGLEVTHWPVEAEAFAGRGMTAHAGVPFSFGPRAPYAQLIGPATDLELELVFRVTGPGGAGGHYPVLTGYSLFEQ